MPIPARLPLSAKILLWFFLNVTLLGAVFILLFDAQFRFDMDWVFVSSARQRVDAMRDLIVSELNTTPPDEWDRVIEQFSDAYHVRFALFDDERHHLIGAVDPLPAEVQERMPPPAPDGVKRGRHIPWVGPPVRAFVRTTHPRHYWLLMSANPDNPQAGGPMRVMLVAEANSFSVGGLIVDLVSWIWVAIGAFVFSVLFWLPLLRGITRSIGQLTDATKQIAEGRFDVRVPARRRDELGTLAEAINQMAARLDGYVKGQKRFLGDVAHELCAPLARLQMALGILDQRADDRQKGYTRSATEKAAQIATLVNELVDFSRASYGASAIHLEPVEVLAVAEEAIRREAREGVAIEKEIPAGLMVRADAELLVRSLANLLRNAIRYGGKEGPISVNAAGEGRTVRIRVADCGPGVPEEELQKIFDAFYRVDRARMRDTGGAGIGLAIVKACIDSCRGTVMARNREPHGLEVVIVLPGETEASPAM